MEWCTNYGYSCNKRSGSNLDSKLYFKENIGYYHKQNQTNVSICKKTFQRIKLDGSQDFIYLHH